MKQIRVADKSIALWLPDDIHAGTSAAIPHVDIGGSDTAPAPNRSQTRTGELSDDESAVKIAPLRPLPLIYLNEFSGDGRAVWEACRHLGCPPFALAVISGLDWNRELSPWECDGTVRDAEPFAGGADGYLDELLGEIQPSVERLLPAAPAWRGIAGYSLAGLFALWSLWQTDTFARAASASGSLWFPGFSERAAHKPLAGTVEAVYLSLGKKETRTPNRMMRHVLEDTRRMKELLTELGVATAFELNPGNHFSQTDERMAKGISWILRG